MDSVTIHFADQGSRERRIRLYMVKLSEMGYEIPEIDKEKNDGKEAEK